MTAAQQEVERVLRECARWQIPVRHITKELPDIPLPGWHEAPSTYGGIDWSSDWRERTIAWDDYDPNSCALLHEMAHVVIGIAPDVVDEPNSGMLALEYHTYRRLRLREREWSTWMYDYRFAIDGDEFDWGIAPLAARREQLRRARTAAIAIGVLDANLRPTYRRPKS